jgi:hypothetical protein
MAIKKTKTKKEAQGLLVYQNLPALSRSLFGDPELWVRTHQVILTNWSRLNQVFEINFIHPKVRSSTMNKPDLDPI